MRTLMFILGGFVLLAACVGMARLMSRSRADPMRLATVAFVALWLVIASANMWLGVATAGYSVAEEFPIFLLIFGLPAAAALFVRRKLL